MDFSIDDYEEGYANGMNEGRQQGYKDGYNDCSKDYEARLAKYWVELQTLNARVDYLNKVIDHETK